MRLIVTFLRSSSINAYEMCPHKYLLEYQLGIPSETNKKANKGTIAHKVLESLALHKFAQQNNNPNFLIPEIGLFDTDKFPNIETITKLAYEHYKSENEHNDWSAQDLKDCIDWVHLTLEWDNGAYDPRKRNIFAIEQFFDITIFEDWAKYEYKTPDGSVIDGYLGIKGNIDFIIDNEDGHLTILDWKYGKRVDWGANPIKDKNYEDFVTDKQLLLYAYAMNKLHPWAKLSQTIFYVLDGGPFTVPRGPEDLVRAESMLRTYFEKIRKDQFPKQILTFKCKKFCYFGMNKYTNSKETICDYLHNELIDKGLHQVMREYGKPNHYSKYGSGGGKTDGAK